MRSDIAFPSEGRTLHDWLFRGRAPGCTLSVWRQHARVLMCYADAD
ncbi:hypothetical protein [Acetobacter fallax]|uniref:Uncharacterized protein n=1 Tax=Acetobacter fallax TaxID=1737473 RepID=A0ABX0KCB3_9PROT|nr:hypothetical protein [Acetobacter fallax]NHO32766.1 hypothetical protein [Acetobacter fallax]NHO36329.1 hypothetical protein [Acetobacter fallax]